MECYNSFIVSVISRKKKHKIKRTLLLFKNFYKINLLSRTNTKVERMRHEWERYTSLNLEVNTNKGKREDSHYALVRSRTYLKY